MLCKSHAHIKTRIWIVGLSCPLPAQIKRSSSDLDCNYQAGGGQNLWPFLCHGNSLVPLNRDDSVAAQRQG